MVLRAGQWAALKPQLGADPRPAGPGPAAPGSPRSSAPRAQDRPAPPRAPRRHPPRTRLPTVWLASCFMRLNCFFMAAAAAATGRGARAGESWGPSGGSYIVSRPERRRPSLQLGPALAASLPGLSPAPPARPSGAERSRTRPKPERWSQEGAMGGVKPIRAGTSEVGGAEPNPGETR